MTMQVTKGFKYRLYKIKQALKNRNLPFKTVIAQRARMNAERALREAIQKPERGFPKFKNSSETNQSFTFLPQKAQ